MQHDAEDADNQDSDRFSGRSAPSSGRAARSAGPLVLSGLRSVSIRHGGSGSGRRSSARPLFRLAVSVPVRSQEESREASAQEVSQEDSHEWEEVAALLRELEDADAFELDCRLRRAYRDGELSSVKAQGLLPLLMLDVVSDGEPDGVSDDGTEGEGDGGGWRAAWVAWAQRVTVRRLTEDVERALVLRAAHEHAWSRCKGHPERVRDPIPPGERPLCAAGVDPEATERERLRWWVPIEVGLLFTGVRETLGRRLEVEQGRPVTDGEVFKGMLDEALRSWTVREPGSREPDPVIERDGDRCAVPGCRSRRNLQNHHIVFRSLGSSDESWNRVMLCAFHHQRGVHAGRLRVRGQAPERLVFELGLRDGGGPRGWPIDRGM